MAKQRPINQDNEEPTLHSLDKEVTIINEKLETLNRHDRYNKENFDTLFVFMQDFKVSLIKIDNNLEKLKDLPDKVRKLEDKSIAIELIKTLGWLIVGALIAGFVSQSFIATNERKDYNITRSK